MLIAHSNACEIQDAACSENDEYAAKSFSNAPSKPKNPASWNRSSIKTISSQRVEPPKLLACEREENENFMSDSDDDTAKDNNQSGGHENEPITGNRKRGRQAAMKAQKRILKQFRVFEQGAVAVDSSDSSVDDKNYTAKLDEEEDDDDESEILDSNESEDTSYMVSSNRGMRRRALPSRTSARKASLRHHQTYVFTSNDSDDESEAEILDRIERDLEKAHEEELERKAERKRLNKSRVSVNQRHKNDQFNRKVLQSCDRSWLGATDSSIGIKSQYIPQVGDKLVFCVQGHLQYLKEFPMNTLPAWKTAAWKKEWSVVLCTAQNVDYAFPNEGFSVIQAVVNLTLDAVPSDNCITGNYPVSSSQIWDYEAARHLPVKKLRVNYQPNKESEFIICQERFEASLRTTWVSGSRVQVLFAEGASPAQIVSIQEADPKWPNSPWMCVSVVYDDRESGDSKDIVVDNVCPWELIRATEKVRAGRNIEQTLYSQLSVNAELPLALTEKIADGIHELVEDNSHDAGPFIEPVDISQLIDYGTIIPLPMDIRTILSRLENGYYRHVEAILADVALIKKNCFRYNSRNAPICQCARRFIAELTV